MEKAEIGIIGGTGIYESELLKNVKEISVNTPYGKPSDSILIGDYYGRRVAILFRHGRNHSTAPHLINYRANIHALKQLGVKRIISSSAVGSLQDDIHPGDIVFVDQFIDRTHGRESSFYGEGKVCHISVADPVCPELHSLLAEAAKKLGIAFRANGTYVCINGPRFSTRAESRLYRSWNAHVIGMTLVPECVLAREAEICYASIATVTDYDTFKEEAVSIEKILEIMKENLEKVKKIIAEVIPKIPVERNCFCKDALKDAFV
ncbi:MAG: S-methyl-5'-thioadenosine phosphorylase [Candidatus Aenigmatarchaeota archaeon]|nr:MAG: S-methyl-5'-thioadenosine phosphorylase [Candidatus Aenigmarchaeota archaeon]